MDYGDSDIWTDWDNFYNAGACQGIADSDCRGGSKKEHDDYFGCC